MVFYGQYTLESDSFVVFRVTSNSLVYFHGLDSCLKPTLWLVVETEIRFLCIFSFWGGGEGGLLCSEILAQCSCILNLLPLSLYWTYDFWMEHCFLSDKCILFYLYSIFLLCDFFFLCSWLWLSYLLFPFISFTFILSLYLLFFHFFYIITYSVYTPSWLTAIKLGVNTIISHKLLLSLFFWEEYDNAKRSRSFSLFSFSFHPIRNAFPSFLILFSCFFLLFFFEVRN